MYEWTKKHQIGFRDLGEWLIFFLKNFNLVYLRNKAVEDLCSYEEFSLKSSKDYRPSGPVLNYETLCISEYTWKTVFAGYPEIKPKYVGRWFKSEKEA